MSYVLHVRQQPTRVCRMSYVLHVRQQPPRVCRMSYVLHVRQQPPRVCRMSYVLHVRQQHVAVPFEQQFTLSDCWLSVTNQNVRPYELSPLLSVAIK